MKEVSAVSRQSCSQVNAECGKTLDAAFLGRRQSALLVGGNTLQEEQNEVLEGSADVAQSLSLGKTGGSSSQHHQPGFLASPSAALATAVSQSTFSSISSSSAVATTESVDSMTPPPSYTPISTSVDVESGVPLYIPVVDPSAQSGSVEVAYLGPGNAGATLYEVISRASDRSEMCSQSVFLLLPVMMTSV